MRRSFRPCTLRSSWGSRRARPGPLARAFTLIELLLVISIFVILLLIVVPAFTSMLYSAEESLAQNALRSALSAGRDAAMRSSGDDDGAAVFFFEPGGRMTVVPCVRVGQLTDLPNGPGTVVRDVFVPLNLIEPVQLPRNWMARGFAPPGSLDGDPTGPNGGNPNGWYEGPGRYNPAAPNWVFPETAFYDLAVPDDGADRQTFMVRFKAGSGELDTSGTGTAIVVAPRPSQAMRNPTPAWQRADKADDLGRWARRILADRTLTVAQRRALIGDESGDTVLARGVGELVLYNEKRLAGAIDARLDRRTGTLYQSGTEPRFVTGADALRMNQWLEGRLPGPDGPVESDARIFVVGRYQGDVQEVVQ